MSALTAVPDLAPTPKVVVTTQEELTIALLDRVPMIVVNADPRKLLRVTDTGRTGALIVEGESRVLVNGNAVVTARGCAVITVTDHAAVTAQDFVRVTALRDSVVQADGAARIVAHDRVVVSASETAYVRAYDDTTAVAGGSVRLMLHDNSVGHLYGKAIARPGGKGEGAIITHRARRTQAAEHAA